MIPLHDDVPSQRVPLVNYGMLGLCTVMFGLQLSAGPGNGSIVEKMGMVPARLTAPEGEQVLVPDQMLIETPLGIQLIDGFRPLDAAVVPEWLTLITCVFLHGGWLHFLGNMWFLWVFGHNVESRLGHVAYAALYLGTGIVAGLCHLIINFDSTAPTIGASGAIAGVMGAYLLMFPRARVMTIIPMLFLWPLIELPAPIFLGVWFLIQFWNGASGVLGQDAAGVAWWAHVGGFMAGVACAAAVGRPRPPGAG